MQSQQRIGQCLLLGFQGAQLRRNSTIARAIHKGLVGGVILFDRHLASRSASNNIIDARQIRQLTTDLQDLAGGKLIIAVDQEGGRVSRFIASRGFPVSEPAGVLGQHFDTSATRTAARQTAAMLAEAGVTLNLAPVVDLNIHPGNPIIGRYQRSFAVDPVMVARHAAVWIEEHHQQQICCCLKHFPGHGSSQTDSHLGFTDISASWQDSELQPYRQLLHAGLADAVMTGHLFHRQLDAAYPATLSPAVVNGLLRQQLGFTGPVISDDLQMQAITSQYGFAESCWRALAAGVDIVLIGNNLVDDSHAAEHFQQAIGAALADGRLREERLTEAGQRIQQLKKFSRKQQP